MNRYVLFFLWILFALDVLPELMGNPRTNNNLWLINTFGQTGIHLATFAISAVFYLKKAYPKRNILFGIAISAILLCFVDVHYELLQYFEKPFFGTQQTIILFQLPWILWVIIWIMIVSSSNIELFVRKGMEFRALLGIIPISAGSIAICIGLYSAVFQSFEALYLPAEGFLMAISAIVEIGLASLAIIVSVYSNRFPVAIGLGLILLMGASAIYHVVEIDSALFPSNKVLDEPKIARLSWSFGSFALLFGTAKLGAAKNIYLLSKSMIFPRNALYKNIANFVIGTTITGYVLASIIILNFSGELSKKLPPANQGTVALFDSSRQALYYLVLLFLFSTLTAYGTKKFGKQVSVGLLRFVGLVNAEVILQKTIKIFISYSRVDEPKVLQFERILFECNYTVIRDRYAFPAQGELPLIIMEQIKRCECVIVFWSSYSVRSDWVRKEIDFAIDMSMQSIKQFKIYFIGLDENLPPPVIGRDMLLLPGYTKEVREKSAIIITEELRKLNRNVDFQHHP